MRSQDSIILLCEGSINWKESTNAYVIEETKLLCSYAWNNELIGSAT